MRLFIAFSFFFLSLSVSSQERTHIVQPGETIYSLARRYHTSVQAILEKNNVSDVSRIRSGSVLIIPGDEVEREPNGRMESHIVEPGETIYSLARTYKMSPEELMSLNGLDDPRRLRIGMRLKVNNAARPEQPRPLENRPEIVRVLPLNSEPVLVNRPLPGLTFREPGAEFKAVTGGTVVHRDLFRGVGNLLLVDSGNGLVYGYAGWTTTSLILGQRVEPGQSLGKIASDPPGSLLYFVYHRTSVVPPEQYFHKN